MISRLDHSTTYPLPSRLAPTATATTATKENTMAKTPNNDILLISRDDIQVDHEWNTRSEEDYEGETTLATLTKSIAKNGLLQPVIARKLGDDERKGKGPHYALVAGFRRVSVLDHLEITTFPATIIDATADESLVANLIENVQRESLSNASLAVGLAKLSNCGMSGVSIASRVGLSKGHVNNLIRIAQNLCAKAWELFKAEKITINQATTVLAAGPGADEQHAALDRVLGLRDEDEDEGGEDDGGEGGRMMQVKPTTGAGRTRSCRIGEAGGMGTLLQRG